MKDVPTSALTEPKVTRDDWRIILASSAGTAFEWYDYYLFISMAGIIGAQFFSQFPEHMRGFFSLVAFAAAFIARPFGALVFGRIGDRLGRKFTFLVTILVMGGATLLIGFLPSAETIGIAAPILLLFLRVMQGLSIGGEYGGAVTYVAEHAPNNRRGFFTSFVQVTGSAGLLISLAVVTAVITIVGADAFKAWGWRIPFILSVVLLVTSIIIRVQLKESPAFQKIKADGTRSKYPIVESFLVWSNLKFVLIALTCVMIGQGVVWYTGQLYPLVFLTQIAKVDSSTANIIVSWVLIVSVPLFVVFGALSDRVGRRPLILGSCLLAAATIQPIFKEVMAVANPALDQAQRRVVAEVIADPQECHFQFNPIGTSKFTTGCDVISSTLIRSAVQFTRQEVPGAVASVRLGDQMVTSYRGLDPSSVPDEMARVSKDLSTAMTAAGYPAASNPSVVRVSGFFDVFRGQPMRLIGLLLILAVYATMIYGPVAAALVELFPTRIRYTSMSLPYHIGAGWFGGLMPATAVALSAEWGNVYFGLWYPVVFATLTALLGLFFLPETKDRDIFSDGEGRS